MRDSELGKVKELLIKFLLKTNKRVNQKNIDITYVGEFADQILALFPPTLSESGIIEILYYFSYMSHYVNKIDSTKFKELAHALSGRIEKKENPLEVGISLCPSCKNECRYKETDHPSQDKVLSCTIYKPIEKVTTDTQKYCECEEPIISEHPCCVPKTNCVTCGKPLEKPLNEQYGCVIEGKWIPLSKLPSDINELNKLIQPEK